MVEYAIQSDCTAIGNVADRLERDFAWHMELAWGSPGSSENPSDMALKKQHFP